METLIKNFKFENKLTLPEIVEDNAYIDKTIFMYTKILKSARKQKVIVTPVKIAEVNKLSENPKDNEYVVQFFELEEGKVDPGISPVHKKTPEGNPIPHVFRINLEGVMKFMKGSITVTSYFSDIRL